MKKSDRKKEKSIKRSPAAPPPRPDAREPFVKRELYYVAAIFLVGISLRLIYFFLNKSNNPLFYHPILDSLFHDEWAREILQDNFWGSEVFFRAPLYPYMLALLYKVSGNSIAFATFTQHVMGALSPVLVYFLSRRFFSVTTSVLAGGLGALYWPFIYFEGELLIVTLILFLDVLLLLTLAIAVQNQRNSLFVLAGFTLGLSAVARPTILIFLPAVPLALYYASGSKIKNSAKNRRWIRQAVLLIGGSLIAIVPVLVRNYVVGRDFVPIASQGGVNFYIGNNPQANGTAAVLPGVRWDFVGTFRGAAELAEREVGRKLKSSEVSDYYFKKGLEFIVYSPGQALRLFLKKLYFFWAGVERSNEKYIQFFWHRFGLGKIPLAGFWLIAPLALTGGVLLWNRRRELGLLYVFVLSYMVGVVIFFVNARFRLPVVPVLLVFAAAALRYFYTAFRGRSPVFFKALLILTISVLIVDLDFATFRGVRAFDEAVSHYVMGNAYMKMGKNSLARDEFEMARSINDRYPTAGYSQIAATVNANLGFLYKEQGDYARAISSLKRVRGDQATEVYAGTLLADCYVKLGRIQEAMDTYAAVLRIDPNQVQSLVGLARIHKDRGERDRALEYFLRVRSLIPPDPTIEMEINALKSGR